MTVAELRRFIEEHDLREPSGAGTHSIVDEAGTLAGWLGSAAASEGPRIDWLADELASKRGIVFVIADGLGVELLDAVLPAGFIRRNTTEELRSVFPSTTATALTSLASGRWAGSHGVTGWWTHVPHLSRTLCALTFRERGTNLLASSLGLGMADITCARSLYRTDRAAVSSLLPQYLKGSTYARWTRNDTPILGYRTPGHALRKAGRRARATEGRFLLSVYLPVVDATVHKWGTAHAETHAVIRELDRGLERLADRLPSDVALLVTADHGLVDLDQRFHAVLEPGDSLLEGLVVPPTGEGTAPIFHVRTGAEDDVREALDRTEAGRAFELVPTDTLADAGFFGPDGIDERVRPRFGTHVGIAATPALLEYVPEKHRSVRHRGVHGGLRSGEMRVPLCLVDGVDR